MTRTALCALLVLTATAAPPLRGANFAAPPGPQDKALAQTFAELLPGMAATDNNARKEAQEKWQDICLRAGAPGSEALRTEACALMAARLGPRTPNPARVYLLKQLERIGRDECVAAVASLLGDRDDLVRDAAVRCLANNPSPKATARLTARLPEAAGKAKVGLLNALGYRGDPAAVGALDRELSGSDKTAAAAAARALGRIPGPEAYRALAAARPGARGALRLAVCNACLIHADRLLREGKAGEAATIYRELNRPGEPRPVHLGALRGTLQAAGDRAGADVLELLASPDEDARAIAVGQIEGLSARALEALAANLDKLPAPSRVRVLSLLGRRGGPAVGRLGLSATPASATRKVRVIIIDGQNNHNWRATTPVLKKILEDSGRFSVDVSSNLKKGDKPGDVAPTVPFPPDLSKYDVLLSNYNGAPWPKEFETALEERLRGGKIGLVIIHAANNAFGKWTEYNQMIGMGWRSKDFGERLRLDDAGRVVRVPRGEDLDSGHRSGGKYPIVVRDAHHPITRGMPREWMHNDDELYDNLRGPIKNVHLLATAYSRGTKAHEPMIWTVAYGKGRVFHTPMGHDVNSMRCVGFATTVQRGTEWAATGEVTIPIPLDFPTEKEVRLIR